MRPINKPNNSKVYTRYQNARNDLAEKIGWYCSYCEMPVKNMVEVEHVIPRKNGGDELDWDNFLLSCKYCNTVKSNKNDNRNHYIWPDEDHTFKAFQYSSTHSIIASASITDSRQHSLIINTILLTGLNRGPLINEEEPTPNDTRWISRQDSWTLAKDSLDNYIESEYHKVMIKQIANSAFGSGHFSIWMEVFKDYPEIRNALIEKFPGTDTTCFDLNGNVTTMPKGKI